MSLLGLLVGYLDFSAGQRKQTGGNENCHGSAEKAGGNKVISNFHGCVALVVFVVRVELKLDSKRLKRQVDR